MVVVATCIALSIVFAGVALAFFLNSLLNSVFLGFLIVSLLWVVGVVVLVVLTSKRGTPLFTDTFVRLFVGLFYDQNEKDK